MKTILVPATGTDSDAMVFQAALDVARLFGGHIDFLHARMSPGDLAADLAVDGVAGLSVGIIEKLDEQGAQQEAKARGAFDRFVQREGLGSGAVSTSWHCELGREEDWVPEYGRTSDLTIVGRPTKDDGASLVTQEAALLESGRPILIPAGRPVAPDSIAIAWKPTREAARAVAAATPFLTKAKRVVILTVSEEGHEDAACATRLQAALRRHHAAVDLRQLEADARPAAQALLAEANALGAGLLVMGGYGHGRLREWVFGGVTEYVLRAAAMPVLMAH